MRVSGRSICLIALAKCCIEMGEYTTASGSWAANRAKESCSMLTETLTKASGERISGRGSECRGSRREMYSRVNGSLTRCTVKAF